MLTLFDLVLHVVMTSFMTEMVLVLKNFAFTIILPGTVMVVIPSLILGRDIIAVPSHWGMPQCLALFPVLLGGSIYFRCLWDFVSVGRGTPAPIDPPKELVVRGFYRYVRNPMYLGVLLPLLGEAVFWASFPLLAYAGGVFIFFHLWVVFIEEPLLQHKFGESYQQYCQSVHRWVPGR